MWRRRWRRSRRWSGSSSVGCVLFWGWGGGGMRSRRCVSPARMERGSHSQAGGMEGGRGSAWCFIFEPVHIYCFSLCAGIGASGSCGIVSGSAVVVFDRLRAPVFLGRWGDQRRRRPPRDSVARRFASDARRTDRPMDGALNWGREGVGLAHGQCQQRGAVWRMTAVLC